MSSFTGPAAGIRAATRTRRVRPAALRWEYRPGSTFFLVWQQQRSENHRFGDFSLSRDAGDVFDPRPDNISLMKVSYWFGR